MSVPVAQRTVELPDVDFLATVTVYDYYVEFVLYDIVSRNGNVPLLRRSGTDYEETEKPEEADVYLHGSVKWDGCSNWHFDEQDRVMLHGCSPRAASNVLVMPWPLAGTWRVCCVRTLIVDTGKEHACIW